MAERALRHQFIGLLNASSYGNLASELPAVRALAEEELKKEEYEISRLLNEYLHGAQLGLRILTDPSQLLPNEITHRLAARVDAILHEIESDADTLPPTRLDTLKQLVTAHQQIQATLKVCARIRSLPERVQDLESQFRDLLPVALRAPRDLQPLDPSHLLSLFKHALALATEACQLADGIFKGLHECEDREVRRRAEAELGDVADAFNGLWTSWLDVVAACVRRWIPLSQRALLGDPDPALLVTLAKAAVLHDRVFSLHQHQRDMTGASASASTSPDQTLQDNSFSDVVFGLLAVAERIKEDTAAQMPAASGLSHASPPTSPSRPVALGSLHLSRASMALGLQASLSSPTGPTSAKPAPSTLESIADAPAGSLAGSPPAAAVTLEPSRPSQVTEESQAQDQAQPLQPTSEGLQVPDREAMLEWLANHILCAVTGKLQSFLLKGRCSSPEDGADQLNQLLESVSEFAEGTAPCLPPRCELGRHIRASVQASFVNFLETLLDPSAEPEAAPKLGSGELLLLLSWIGAIEQFAPGSGDLHVLQSLLITRFLDYLGGRLHDAYAFAIRADLQGPLQQTSQGLLWTRGSRDFLQLVQDQLRLVMATGNVPLVQSTMVLVGQALGLYGRDVIAFFALGASESHVLEGEEDLEQQKTTEGAAWFTSAVSSSFRRLRSGRTGGKGATRGSGGGGSGWVRVDVEGPSALSLPPISEPPGDRIDRCCAMLNNARVVLGEIGKHLKVARDDERFGGHPGACEELQRAQEYWGPGPAGVQKAVRSQLIALIQRDMKAMIWDGVGSSFWYSAKGGSLLRCVEPTLCDYLQDLSRYLDRESELFSDVRLALIESTVAQYLRLILRGSFKFNYPTVIDPLSRDRDILRTLLRGPVFELPSSLSGPLVDLVSDVIGLLTAPSMASFQGLWFALYLDRYGVALLPLGTLLLDLLPKLRSSSHWGKKDVEDVILPALNARDRGPQTEQLELPSSVERVLQQL